MNTYASFYDIVEGVKEETGITNLVNRYNEFIRLIVRAERDINPYAGHFLKKKIKYKNGFGSFNGTSIKVPEDFIQLIGIYDRIEIGRQPLEIRDNNTHILLCNGQINPTAVLSYWASQLDPQGFPFVPYTHFEAVVAFICWKIYSQKTFMGDGNANLKIHFQENYERFARAARGFDFFPTAENMKNMRSLDSTERRFAVVCDDDCFCACGIEEITTPNVSDMKIWYWQENSLVQEIFEDDVTETFLLDKQQISDTTFKNGAYFSASYVGRYGIAIENGPNTPIDIIDVLGSSIIDSVNYQYYAGRKLLVLISKNYITPGTFFLKLK